MAKYTGNVLTNLGKDLLARAVIGGEVLTFTKVELGKGAIAGANQEEFTELVDSFKVLPITSTAKLEGGSYRVRTAFSNSGIAVDTYLREVGVFARGEDGVEILYSYCNTDTPDLIPAEGAGVLERVEDVITYISNAANINAVIDQSKVYVTIKELTEGLDTKEDKFDKNDGFNREKTDSISLANSLVLATAKAVKTAYDKAVSALNTADTKEPKITKKTGFNLDKTDSTSTDSSIILATAKAVKAAYDKVIEVLGFTNINKAAILNNTEQIENLITTKEFVVFDGIGGIDIKASNGIDSVIRTSTGNYTITFTNTINENALLNVSIVMISPSSKIHEWCRVNKLEGKTMEIRTGAWLNKDSAHGYDSDKVSISLSY